MTGFRAVAHQPVRLELGGLLTGSFWDANWRKLTFNRIGSRYQ